MPADWTVCGKCLLPRNIATGMTEASVSIRCQCGGRIGPLDSVCPSCRKPKPRIDVGRSDDQGPARPKSAGTSAVLGSLLMGAAAIAAGYLIFSTQLASRPSEPAAQAVAGASTATASALPGSAPADPQATTEALPLAPQEWLVRGKVYDLLTLSPVARCKLVLTDKVSGKRFAARTGTDGRYSVKLPPLSEGGYSVTLLLGNRAWPFLEEMDPPYRQQDRNRRESSLELLTSPSLVHVPIMLPGGQAELDYDLVVSAPPRL